MKLLMLFLLLPLYLVAQSIPVIDFADSSIHHDRFAKDAWVNGYHAFNYSPELAPFFENLAQKAGISVAVETGTEEGRTSVALANLFRQVHTIEFASHKYNATKKNLSQFSNVHCYQGDSVQVLQQLLPKLQSQPVFFYLDAHGFGSFPLNRELEEISKTHKDNCVVVIDDFQVPGRPEIGYDSYPEGECSFAFIQSSLGKVFNDYECLLVIPKNPAWRAKFVAFPRHWDINIQEFPFQ